ncbi:His/Gly/Thr/Pro-type tRNA ligase C-terminal domain-containing protein [Candidatus Wolfebacteria bacterium]|nr:His/Gly/Thr/Pro-type tRNA ligase C-terminal domain-containing protein [Candidatus Wolfebacteria bacterium]
MNPFAKEEKKRTYVDVENILPRMRYDGPHRRGIEIADFYGFRLLRPVKIERDDRDTRGPSERIALIRNYLEHGLDACTQPVHLCHTVKIPYQQELQLHLDVIGSDKSIVEALLIHAARTILAEHGYINTTVVINSVGGKNSADQYMKELSSYCRAHMNEFDTHCREALKHNPLQVFACDNPVCREILAQGPQSVAFLSETSRARFYEILEGLEELDIPYAIDTRLIGTHPISSHTIFEIRADDENEEPEKEPAVLARGERYDYLARKAGLGRQIPAAGVAITLSRLRSTAERFNPYKIQRPRERKAYLVHLGLPAKRFTLVTLEQLRTADIPVMTLLAEESLTEQLQLAEFLGIPIIIIIGQKEVMEGTAIVRDRETRSQVSIPRNELPRYLKRMQR